MLKTYCKKVLCLTVVISLILSLCANNTTHAEISEGHMWEFLASASRYSWSPPVTGTYKIEAWGASGTTINFNVSRQYISYGGKGAYMSGTIKFNGGETLTILVGGSGGNLVSSGLSYGGGGSFVAYSNNIPIVVAGGGGGAGARYQHTGSEPSPISERSDGTDATLFVISNNSANGYVAGSADGQGGKCSSGNMYSGYGGAGFYGGGETNYGTPIASFVDGGGSAGRGQTINHYDVSGGGGSGYSGGPGGLFYYGGGGGGSYNILNNQQNRIREDDGHGHVRITYLGIDDKESTIRAMNAAEEALKVLLQPSDNVVPDGNFSTQTLQAPYSSAQNGTLSFTIGAGLPAGGNILKHTATSNSSYTSPYTGTTGKLADANPGEVWAASVFVKATQSNTATRLYIIPLNASNNSFSLQQKSLTVGTDWQRIEFAFTMPAGTKGIATRLDNPTSGREVHWNGWELRKISLLEQIQNSLIYDERSVADLVLEITESISELVEGLEGLSENEPTSAESLYKRSGASEIMYFPQGVNPITEVNQLQKLSGYNNIYYLEDNGVYTIIKVIFYTKPTLVGDLSIS